MKKIIFITTGDIKNIATSKRALGLANPLADLGWEVSIIMEDTLENRHRVHMECNDSIHVLFLKYTSAMDERKKKENIVKAERPDVVYICAFVFRNIIKTPHGCIRLVEHSELQSSIPDLQYIGRIRAYIQELYSVVYSTGILNASKYLEAVYKKYARLLLRGSMPMLYFPYAYNRAVCIEDDNCARLFNKDKRDRVFVFLGSLTINYGAMIMVKAFEKVSQENKHAKLLLCGKGPAYEQVCEYIKNKNLDNTVFAIGYIDEEDIPGYFTLADAFISPMNNTIQDKARCPSKLYMYLPYKKPIITCKIGEPFETLGDRGVYFEPSDSDSLADVVIDLCRKDCFNLDINPLLYEWTMRAKELDCWVKTLI